MEVLLKDIKKTVNDIDLLKDINITLKSGNAYGFMGANGCGKTVLFKVIVGLMKQTEGNIYVDNEIKNGFLQDCGVIIEGPNFIPYYDGFQNLKVIASYNNKINDEQIRAAITKVGLDAYSKKKVKNYSLGMKQKLGIALAIMEDPSVLILDEPLNSLDEASVNNIRSIILEEKEKGKMILIASHLKDDLSILCDVVFEMKAGKIIGEVQCSEKN